MNRHLFIPLLALLLGLVIARPQIAHAIPASIGISGSLQDEHGLQLDLTGSFKARVGFYAAQTGGSSLSDVLTTATIVQGNYSLRVEISPVVLQQDKLWYALAIDTNNNGLDPADQFNARFEIVSVPFALSAEPVTFFLTHSGYISTSTGTRGSIYASSDDGTSKMNVAPFVTPAGGVKFNQMNIHIHRLDAGAHFSFGIYDKEGKLVVSSGDLTSNVEVLNTFIQINHAAKHLRRSEIYFTAISVSTPGLMLRNSMLPSIPLTGIVQLPTGATTIPNSFSVSSIQPRGDIVPVPITLLLTPGPKSAGEDQSVSVRWIPAE